MRSCCSVDSEADSQQYAAQGNGLHCLVLERLYYDDKTPLEGLNVLITAILSIYIEEREISVAWIPCEIIRFHESTQMRICTNFTLSNQ